jgi:hypothetical protein
LASATYRPDSTNCELNQATRKLLIVLKMFPVQHGGDLERSSGSREIHGSVREDHKCAPAL